MFLIYYKISVKLVYDHNQNSYIWLNYRQFRHVSETINIWVNLSVFSLNQIHLNCLIHEQLHHKCRYFSDFPWEHWQIFHKHFERTTFGKLKLLISFCMIRSILFELNIIEFLLQNLSMSFLMKHVNILQNSFLKCILYN